MSRRARWLRRPRTIGLGLVMLAVASPVEARTTDVAMTVVADKGCAPELRAVIAEQLTGVATSVSWSCVVRADDEEPFRVAPAPAGRVQLWIDVSQTDEARLTVRDHDDRFVVRRVPLASGLDEVGREEIGQIVRSAVLAALTGPSETLSRAEAQTAVSSWPPRPAPARSARTAVQEQNGGAAVASSPRATPDARAGPPPTLELGAAAALRAFSSEIPVVGEIGILAAVGGSWPVSLWVEAAYRIPATATEPTVGVEVSALSLRGGLAVSWRRGGRVGFRAGAGAGIERTSFSPRPTGGQVELAPGGSFFVVTGRALVGVELRAAPRFRIGLTAFCDAATTNVHYDLHGPDGTARPVLTAFRLQPGITLSLSGRFGD